MKVKTIIQEELMTLPELREELIAIRDKRSEGADGEEGVGRTLSYELRKSIDHADALGKCTAETSRALMEELEGCEKMSPEIAARLVNIMPETREEVRAIYAKEHFNLLPEDVDAVLDILRKYA